MMDKTVDEIRRVLKKHKDELEEKYGVKEIGVFGSYVRGEQKKGSDVDILVEFHPDASMDLIRFVELEGYLSDLLGVNYPQQGASSFQPAFTAL
ncbi:MAG: nucleotidyltransferase family protein, partial [Candidatus Asgardarchaeia archaeon]